MDLCFFFTPYSSLSPLSLYRMLQSFPLSLSLIPSFNIMFKLSFLSLSPPLSVVLVFTPFTPLFYNSPLNGFIISLLLSILLFFIQTHLLRIRSISLSSFLLHLMLFHSFAPPLYSRLISRCLSTWDIEAIKTGVQKKAGAADLFYMPPGIIPWNAERRGEAEREEKRSGL